MARDPYTYLGTLSIGGALHQIWQYAKFAASDTLETPIYLTYSRREFVAEDLLYGLLRHQREVENGVLFTAFRDVQPLFELERRFRHRRELSPDDHVIAGNPRNDSIDNVLRTAIAIGLRTTPRILSDDCMAVASLWACDEVGLHLGDDLLPAVEQAFEACYSVKLTRLELQNSSTEEASTRRLKSVLKEFSFASRTQPLLVVPYLECFDSLVFLAICDGIRFTANQRKATLTGLLHSVVAWHNREELFTDGWNDVVDYVQTGRLLHDESEEITDEIRIGRFVLTPGLYLAMVRAVNLAAALGAEQVRLQHVVYAAWELVVRRLSWQCEEQLAVWRQLMCEKMGRPTAALNQYLDQPWPYQPNDMRQLMLGEASGGGTWEAVHDALRQLIRIRPRIESWHLEFLEHYSSHAPS